MLCIQFKTEDVLRLIDIEYHLSLIHILNILLKDHTTSKEDIQRNIFWATSDYEYLGEGYQCDSPILPCLITGDNGHVIMPRILKSRDTQTARSREMAEVFTPSWICNAQNNLIDEAWFGRTDVFNTEYPDEQGCHRWRPNSEKIHFPDDKTWKAYVRDNRLEITCGEAPYIVRRYDTTTGETIPIEERLSLIHIWYFLHGSTDGICNLTYLLSLLSKMAVSEVQNTKRGLGYAVHLGQVDSSMLVPVSYTHLTACRLSGTSLFHRWRNHDFIRSP